MLDTHLLLFALQASCLVSIEGIVTLIHFKLDTAKVNLPSEEKRKRLFYTLVPVFEAWC